MKFLRKHGNFLVFLLGALSFVMLLIPEGFTVKAGSLSANPDESVIKFIFGEELNILGLAAMILVIVGAVFAVIPGFDKKNGLLLSALFLIVGGILLLVFPSTVETFIVKLKPGVPLILSGVFAIAGGLFSGLSALA